MVNREDNEFQEGDVSINLEDEMPNIYPDIVDIEPETDSHEEIGNVDDLPTSVIVTNIHSDVFADEKLKKEMEDLFRTFSDNTTFQWLRSFKRLRVNYDGPLAAANARVQLYRYQFYSSCISCYFVQPVTRVPSKYLRPPAPVKRRVPMNTQDLLAALGIWSPGESYELHAPTPTQPAIIVHTAPACRTSNY